MPSRMSGLCLLFVCCVGAHAGVVVHISKKDTADSKPKDQQVVYAQDGLLRIDKLDEAGQLRDMTLIRDGAFWDVNIQQRTYQKFDKAAVAAQQSQMKERMAAMMQSMPPERRAMIEQRMKAMESETHEFKLTDLSRSDHVGTFACKMWQATRDGKPIAEYCVAPKGSIAGGEELVNATHKASAAAADMASASPQMARAIAPIYNLYGKMDGFPVLTRHMSGGQPSDEMIVTGIEKKSLPASQFELPKGYTEVAVNKSDDSN